MQEIDFNGHPPIEGYKRQWIWCPECNSVEWAKVTLYKNWWMGYVHKCSKCRYYILESEWNKIDLRKLKIV